MSNVERRQKQTAVVMPRAICPFFLRRLWLSQSPERSTILPFKPQDPRPTSLEILPTEFAPLNSPIENPVARQLLSEPLSFFCCMQQLRATSSIACRLQLRLVRLPDTCPWSVGVQENPTPAADGDTQY